MSSKKKFGLKNIKSILPKDIDLEFLKVNPFDAVNNVKSKIDKYYSKLKKEREKNKKKISKEKRT